MVKSYLVETCRLFDEFNEKEKELLSEIFNEIEFQKGDVIFDQGDKAEEVLFVREGRIGLYRSDNFGNWTKVALVNGGTPLGECAFFLETFHSLRAVAETDVKTLSLSKESYSYLKEEYIQIAIKLLEVVTNVISVRLKEEDKKFADIFCFFRTVGGEKWRK
ncbi:Crp/Fnr family transcriptional regulator [Desulfurobacterium crinifex]